MDTVDTTPVTRLRGTYEVLDVNAQGKVAHARYVIDALSAEGADGVVAILEHGQVVDLQMPMTMSGHGSAVPLR